MLKGNQRAAANRKAKAPKAPKAPKAVKRSAADVAKGKAHYKVNGAGAGAGKTETLHRTSGAKPDVAKPSHKVVSGKTFGEAFSAARKAQGSGGKFTYKGKEYSTKSKDDKAKPFGKSSGFNAIVPGNLQPKKKMPKNYVER